MTIESHLATPAALVTARRPSLFQCIWPMAGLALGLMVTVAWIALLGYGLVKLL
jgi:demethoxyubiquinone hydroxylase (CLK1/Coq7/Cat5 family)